MLGILPSREVLAHEVSEVNTQRLKVEKTNAISALKSIDAVWNELFPAEQAKVLHNLVNRITVRKDGIAIKCYDKGWNNLLHYTFDPKMNWRPQSNDKDAGFTAEIPMTFAGIEAKR